MDIRISFEPGASSYLCSLQLSLWCVTLVTVASGTIFCARLSNKSSRCEKDFSGETILKTGLNTIHSTCCLYSLSRAPLLTTVGGDCAGTQGAVMKQIVAHCAQTERM